MVEKTAYEILQSREDRAQIQEELINEYKKSLISFTLNIPGPKKDSPSYRKIHEIGMEEIISKVEGNIQFIKRNKKKTGPEGFIVVNMDPRKLKKLTIDIEENHSLGRIFDMDVFDSNHNQVSRSDLGEEGRKCLICNKNAKICSREASHWIEELLERIDKLYREYR